MHSQSGRPDSIPSKEKYYPTFAGLPPEVQVETIEILNRTLATTLDLWMQVRCSHWNVKGTHFFLLYQLFDLISERLRAAADMIGKRIVALGGSASGSVQAVLERSQLPKYPSDLVTGKEHVRALSMQVAIYANCLRNSIDLTIGLSEMGSADMYAEISRTTDESLWLLEAHLQTQPE